MELPKDFGIQGQWIPVNPAKSIPIKRPAPPMTGHSWLDSVDSNGVSSIPWTVPNHGQMAALASASQGQIDGRGSGELRTLVFNSEGGSQVPSYRRLLAINDPAIATRMNLAPFMVARIGSGVGGNVEMNAESSNRNQLLLNGKILLPMNRENGGARLLPVLAPKPQYRSGFPLLPNLNSLHDNNNTTSRVVSEAMLSRAPPATMEKNQRERVQDRLPRDIIDLVGETASYQDLLRTELDKLPQSIANNPVEQCFSNQVESSQLVTSQHQEGGRNVVVDSAEGLTVQQGEGENQDIDLNKTLPQKPKRKKHRPKVIREGKPARTPKTATPKPATPKPPKTTENPSGKRKYVRKKKDVSPQESPTKPQETSSSAALGEIVDQDSQSRRKSVRRSLNFNLEDSQATDRLSGSAPMMFRQNVLESQGRETHAAAETVGSSQKAPAVHCSQGQGSVVLESSMRSGVGFNLNGLTNQSGNKNLRIPKTQNQPAQLSRQEILGDKWQEDFERLLTNMSPSQQPSVRREGENLKKLARMMNCQNIPGNHERHSIGVQGQAASNRNSDLQHQGAKRDYNLVDNAQAPANMSVIQANNGARGVIGNYNASSIDPCSPDIHKRRRIENGQKELTPNASSISACTPSSGWRTVRTMQNTSGVSTFADAQRMDLEKSQSLTRVLEFNQVERETSGGQVQDHGLISTPTKLAGNYKRDCSQPPTPEKTPGNSNGQETENYGPKARVEVLIAKQMKSKARRQRKKEQDPPVNSMPTNANQMENVAPACQIRLSPTTESAPQGSSNKSAHLGASTAQDHHTSSSYKVSAYRGFRSGSFGTYWDPIDEIVRRLSLLNINVWHEDVAVQPQNALVPYVAGNGTMVPFEGPFVLVKKRKPRPKVDLDPESNRVWKLLMGKEEGEEGTDIDKEKWWEEERRVFRGRADSFIARMHLIQGDRRFSPWKGSVVDSVIGVFLTQNVSDHLSSSAFMCLAARFPPQSKGNAETANGETISRPIVINDTTIWQGEVSQPEFCGQSSLGINESEKIDNKETANSNESLESNNGGGTIDYSKESSLDFHDIELGIGHESPDSNLGPAGTVTSCTSAVEGDDRKSLEDVVSSQNSVVSSQNSTECPGQIADQSKLSPLLNFEANELLTGGTGCFSSFRELLEMADGRVLNDLKATGNERISSEHGGRVDWTAALRIDKSPSVPNGPAYLNGAGLSIHTSNSRLQPVQHNFPSSSCAPSSSYSFQNFSSFRFEGMEKADVIINESNRDYLPQPGFRLHETNINETMGRQYGSCTASSTNAMNQNWPLISSIAPRVDSLGPISKNLAQPISSSGIGVRLLQSEMHSYCQSEASSDKNASGVCLNQQDGNAVMFQHREREEELQIERTWKAIETQAEIHNCGTLQTCSNSQNDSRRNNLVAGAAAESNLRNEVSASEKASAETLNNAAKAKKVRAETEKKTTFDWDSLRKQVCQNGARSERSRDRMDSLDYEALRNADVNEISNTIRERGMNNMLAERIKDFLNRLVRDHGSIDLEWLRDIPPDKAKDYLLSIRGLGLKSVECVRLLTLHHLAFPVDTNVGRICVRLGWVPIQPLPESLQLHLLEMYPVLETIQKYLWPRLCKLDQRTLYELHYQLITFGKVFCTKSKPNCNACPMRGECKHFASAFASARLALPGPEEKRLVPSEVPLASDRSHGPFSNPMPLPQLEGSTLSQEQTVPRNCEPIIEEPTTPEPECIKTSEIDIEDAFYNDPDEIPTIKLNFEEFTQNLQNYMQENNTGLQDGDMSKALVAIIPEAASIPMPKLKNVSRLRTEHLVYELPDSHPLLEGLDRREPDDHCPYLLAIWTPGETAQSTEPPTACCSYQDMGKLCDKSTCFSCNSIREAQAQMVRGTLLIPCRTANRGSFPLNGTYFQVNEVFADHDSSRNPIDVPRDWIWNLHRRTVYFGTSIPSIFKGLTTEGIQHCFWRGFVCVRGFDRTSRAPRPLFARLHFPASKVTRNKKQQEQQGKRSNAV